MKAVEVAGIDTYYGQSHILHGVSLAATGAAATALLGRNGAGKTTLMRSIIGFTPPRSGRILFGGEEIQRLPSHQISRRGLALVPQGRRIFRSLTVYENLQLSGSAHRRGGQRRFDVASVYDLFPRLKERHRHFGDQLSGGEQQMLAIGRALMTNPEFILMDEPSEGLAPIFVERLGETILKLRAMGLGILLVEQHLPLAIACTQDAYVLTKGEVVWHGATHEIGENEELRHRHLAV